MQLGILNKKLLVYQLIFPLKFASSRYHIHRDTLNGTHRKNKKIKMERLLYDTKASDVAVAWRAAHCNGSTAKLAKLSRKRVEVSEIT